jgi:hypothetical protein
MRITFLRMPTCLSALGFAISGAKTINAMRKRKAKMKYKEINKC